MFVDRTKSIHRYDQQEEAAVNYQEVIEELLIDYEGVPVMGLPERWTVTIESLKNKGQIEDAFDEDVITSCYHLYQYYQHETLDAKIRLLMTIFDLDFRSSYEYIILYHQIAYFADHHKMYGEPF